MVTPNEREARFALADQDSGVRPLASRLFDEAKCRLLILKAWRSRCVDLSKEAIMKTWSHILLWIVLWERLVDAVGAGDALLSYATLTMIATKSEVMATILGSMAAACECERDGNIPIRPEDVMKKIDAAERLAKYK